MSAYTLASFNDIESPNSSDERQMKFARSHIESQHVGVSYFRYAPGFRARFGHSHRAQEEVYVVVSGSGASSSTTRSSS